MVSSDTETPNSSCSRMIRSQARHRTTPWTAGIGPSSTMRARKARCVASSLGGTPGEGMLKRPCRAISAGEWITASGNWINDRTHGQQFKARLLKTSTPTSAEGIEKYLASGMIRGIGPVFGTGVGVLANPRSRLSLIIREPFPGHPLIRRLTRE